MATTNPKRLNPDAPAWFPVRHKQPPSTVQIWIPHYYHHHHYPALIPAVQYSTSPPDHQLHFSHTKEYIKEEATRVITSGVHGDRTRVNDVAGVPRGMVKDRAVGFRPRKTIGRTHSGLCSKIDSTGSTLMIRNIPNQFKSMLMEFLDNLCYQSNTRRLSSFPCKYDFVYLPMDFGQGFNLGYAFVNFTNTAAAQQIKKSLDGFKWGVGKDSYGCCFKSNKVCHVTRARIQGKDNLVKHFQSSRFECHTLDYLPVILSPPRDGVTTFSLPVTVGTRSGF